MRSTGKHFETKLLHCGNKKKYENAHTMPIFQTSTFIFDSIEDGKKKFTGKKEGYIYSRLGNPTQKLLEEKLAMLEEGEDAAVFGSGMAAISTVILSYAKAGDHVVSCRTLYGCTDALFTEQMPKLGISFSLASPQDPKNIEDIIQGTTKLIYLETPANPTMEIADIKKIAKIAKSHGLKLVVDNTFATPYNQRPINLGADIVVHSLTKYLNGHSDVIAGAAVASKKDISIIRRHLVDFGGVMSPEDCYRVLRGLATFPLRMERHNYNAIKLASFLEKSQKVEKVFYPGLKSFPQHKLAKKQMKTPDEKPGYGGIISFELKGGVSAGKKLLDYLAKNSFISLAVSLGCTDTLIQHPASMTHSRVPKKDRLKKGITDGLIRISVGLENYEDLEETLKEALKRV